MGKSEYAEKLKSPKWQRRRLEIMERDNFTCQICGNKDMTLNVHHLCYDGGEPWDTDDLNLITLCDECHKNEHDNLYIVDAIQGLKDSGISAFEIKQLLETVREAIVKEPGIISVLVEHLNNDIPDDDLDVIIKMGVNRTDKYLKYGTL